MNLNRCFVILEKFVETYPVVDSKIRICLFSYLHAVAYLRRDKVYYLFYSTVKLSTTLLLGD